MKPLAKTTLDHGDKGPLLSRITELLSAREPILFAYCYGSFVRDEPFRDIDVGVYLDPNVFKDPDEMFDYTLALGAELDVALSAATIDLRPLNLAPLPFRFGVLTQGRLLFTSDREQQIDFECRTRSLYFDFLPHLRFYYERIVLGE